MAMQVEYGKRQAALVSHITKDNVIYCQLDTEEAYGLADLSERIREYVDTSGEVVQPEAGVCCFAQSNAYGVWYRGLVTNVSGSEVTVYYVDYGNCEVLTPECLCAVSESLFQMPYQAVQCVLSDFMTSSSSSVHSVLQEALLDKEVQFVILSKCSSQLTAVGFVPCYNVALYLTADAATTISETLVENGFGQFKLCNGNVQVGEKYQCYLSFDDSPGKFWVQLSYQYDDLLALMNGLNEPSMVDSLRPLPLPNTVAGAVCCCLYNDDNRYYRAEVVYVGLSDKIAKVCFIDYGNFSSVKLSEVKALPAHLCFSPPFAVQCCLKGIKPLKPAKPHPKLGNIAWTQEVCKKFKSMVEEVELEVTIEKEISPEIFSVCLFDVSKGKDIGQLLCDIKCAEPASSQMSPSPIVSPAAAAPPPPATYTYLTLEIKRAYKNLIISHAESPDIVWCQPAPDTVAFEALVVELNQEGQNFPSLSKVAVDRPCCVQYALDQSWCRGCIQEVDDSQQFADVLYVDFGNVANINWADLRALPSRYLVPPAQAVSFSLAGISPRGGDNWCNEAIECFKELVIDRQLNCKTVGLDEDGFPSAILYDPLKKNRKISLELVDRGYAGMPLTPVEAATRQSSSFSSSSQSHSGSPRQSQRDSQNLSQSSRNPSSGSHHSSRTNAATYPTIDLRADQKLDAIVSHVEFPHKFYIQPVDASLDLEQLMQQAKVHSKSARACPVRQPRVGLPVLSEFLGDDGWYRAVIVGLPNKGRYLVRFIDYGNFEEVGSSQVLELPAELMQLPMQAIPCSLTELKVQTSFPANFVDAFGEMTMEKKFHMVVKGVQKREMVIYDVDLQMSKGQNVTQVLSSKAAFRDFFELTSGAQAVVQVSLRQLPVNKEVEVVMSYAQSPSKFFVHLAESSYAVEQLSDKLNSLYASGGETLADVKVGSFCAAQFSEDKLWYRARVTQLDGSSATVSYIDFGNSEQLQQSSLMVLAEDVAKDTCFAVPCKLLGLQETAAMSPQVLDKFLQLADRSLLGVFQTNMTSYDSIVPTKLMDASQPGVKKDVCTDLYSSRKSAPKPAIESIVPSLNASVDCFVSFVVNPSEMYCQLVSGNEELQLLMDELNVFYGEDRDGTPLQATTVGSLCAVLYTDTLWYRGRVVAISPTGATVHYFDFGNTEDVEVCVVRALESKFCGLRAQAIKCRLSNLEPVSGLEWSSESTEELQSLTLDVPVKVCFLSKNKSDEYDIEVFNGGEDVSTALVKKNLAEKISTTSATSRHLPEPVMTIDPFPVRESSKYHIIVTYAVSPMEMFCQIIDPEEKLDILMEDIAQHCARATGVCNQRWQQGDHVLGLFSEDKAWYRCVITEVKENGAKFDVLYLDYGNFETVGKMAILPISADFCALPAQALKCRLDGAQLYKYSDEAIEEFNLLLLNNEFNMTCVSVAEDYSCTVELYGVEDLRSIMSVAVDKNILQSKISTATASLPDNQLYIQAFPNNIGADTYHDVQVVYAESPTTFFCQFLLDDFEAVQTMMADLQSFYATTSKRNVSREYCQPGSFVAAQFTDDELWYRAVILSVEHDGATVLFVDYGNEDKVGFNGMRELPSQFTGLHAQAVPCGLAEVSPTSKSGWSEDAIEVFNGLCMDRPCIAQIKTSTDMSGKLFKFGDSQRLLVSLISSEDSKNIAEELTNGGHAISCVLTTIPPSAFLQPKLHPGDVHDVYVSYVESPSKFWLQFSTNEDSLTAIQDSLGMVYSDGPEKLPVLKNPVPGNSCCAKFSDDSRWYRGMVVDVHSSGVELYFVDYGNTEVVSLSDVRVLQNELLAWEVQCFCCSLVNCHPVGSEWDESAAGVFSELTASKLLQAHIVSTQRGHCWGVCLKEGSVSICDQLVQSGVTTAESAQQALRPVPSIEKVKLTVGQNYLVYIAYIDSPSKFYCQLTAGNDHLESLMAKVADFYNGNVLEPLLEEGAYCVAQYSSNCAWYRAQIISVLSDKVFVYFIDYGNSEVVTTQQVMALGAQFAELPAQAISCSLVQDVDSPLSDEVVARFNEYDLSLEFSIKVGSVAFSGQYVVELYDDTESFVNDSIFKQELAPPLTVVEYQQTVEEPIEPVEPVAAAENYVPLQYAPGESVDAFVSYITSPTSFFCQPLQLSGELDDMMTEIASFMVDSESVHSIPKDRFKSGTVCLGQFTEDNEWYRAVIEEVISGATALVSFVDYGNKEVLSSDRIAMLPAQFSQQPLQGFHSSLFDAGIKDMTWNVDQVEQFRALVPESDQMTVTVVKYNGDSSQHHVTICKDGQPVDISFLLPQQTSVIESSRVVADLDARQLYQSESANVSVMAQKGSIRESGSDNGETESDDESEGKPLIKGPFKLSLAVQEVLEVSVVYIEGPSLIYLQRVDCKTELLQLGDEIAQYCASIEEGPLVRQTFCEGDFVLAKWSEDSVWYRGEVLGVDATSEDKSSQISFIDYGNVEVIPSDSLVMCPRNFLELPAQAIPCCLAQVPHRDSWPILYRDIISELVENKVLKACVVLPASQGMKPTVKLEDAETGQDISQFVLDKLQEECEGGSSTAIIEEDSETEEDLQQNDNDSFQEIEGVRTEESTGQELRKEPATIITDNSEAPTCLETATSSSSQAVVLPERDSSYLCAGSSHQLYVISCTSPRSFTCQLASETDILEEITSRLSEVYGAMELAPVDTASLTEGSYVAAQFQEDEAWYRARVIGCEGPDHYHVRYVDYGNGEVLPVEFIKRLDESLTRHPEIALEYALSNAEFLPGQSDFLPAAADVMKELVGEEECTIEIVSHDAVGVHHVMLTSSQEVDVLAALVKANMCAQGIQQEDMGDEKDKDNTDMGDQKDEDNTDMGDEKDKDNTDMGDQKDKDNTDMGDQKDMDNTDMGDQKDKDNTDMGDQKDKDNTDMGDEKDKDNTDMGDRDNADIVNNNSADMEDKDNTDMEEKDNADMEDEDNAGIEDKGNADMKEKDNAGMEDKDNADVEDNDNADMEDKGNADVEDTDNADPENKDSSDIEDKDESDVEEKDRDSANMEEGIQARTSIIPAEDLESIPTRPTGELANLVLSVDAQKKKTPISAEFDPPSEEQPLDQDDLPAKEDIASSQDKNQSLKVEDDALQVQAVEENNSIGCNTGPGDPTADLQCSASSDSSVEVSAALESVSFAEEYVSSVMEAGSRHSVCVMSTYSLDDFTCKLLSHAVELNGMMTDLPSQGYRVGVTDKYSCEAPRPTQPVCCCSPKDKQWYRGQIICETTDSSKYKVLHVDFGSIGTYSTDRIRYMKKSLAECLPPQAVKCSLPVLLESDISPGLPSSMDPWELDWPSSCISHFNSLVKDNDVLQMEILGTENVKGSLKYTVKLFVEQFDVHELLVARLTDSSKCVITDSTDDRDDAKPEDANNGGGAQDMGLLGWSEPVNSEAAEVNRENNVGGGTRPDPGDIAPEDTGEEGHVGDVKETVDDMVANGDAGTGCEDVSFREI